MTVQAKLVIRMEVPLSEQILQSNDMDTDIRGVLTAVKLAGSNAVRAGYKDINLDYWVEDNALERSGDGTDNISNS